jgi:hypothetical protein
MAANDRDSGASEFEDEESETASLQFIGVADGVFGGFIQSQF